MNRPITPESTPIPSDIGTTVTMPEAIAGAAPPPPTPRVPIWSHMVIGGVPLTHLTQCLAHYEEQGCELCGVIQGDNASAIGSASPAIVDTIGRPVRNGKATKAPATVTLIFKRPTGSALTVVAPITHPDGSVVQ